MHHDVAAAMIIDPISPNPMVYANILRTNFHRCELTLPNHSFVPINRTRCEYHTCCLPYEQIEYCDYHPESGRRHVRFEPEECHAFVLEHHHERLPYFGNVGPHHVPIPATWREMVRVQASDEELFPRLGRKLREGGKVFTECEKLYTIHNDTAILHAGLRDLRANGTLSSWHVMEAAEASVLESEDKLLKQRRLVSDMWSSVSSNAFLNRALPTTETNNVATAANEQGEQRSSRPAIVANANATKAKSKATPARKQKKQKKRRSSRIAASAKVKYTR
ncbi:hypothetical protein FHL15_006938 [Xylaria flabelliformis]|uniref:Uncharacterized protein n=1 Tax=Xylaria flabelliformis TaxID=2512241 RepID=A0A553HVT9_9PEZI|nr:hypothetical protein FHL15_006938 [Xylaria flabelliformis]